MGKKESRAGNYIFSLLFVALGVFMLATIRLDHYQLASAYSLGPGFFPMWIAIMMILIGGLLIWYTHKGAYDREDGFLPQGQALVRLFLMILLTVVGVMLIESIGMVAAIALYFMSVSRFVCGKTWKDTLISTVIATAAIYIVFNVCFKVKFPVGILGF